MLQKSSPMCHFVFFHFLLYVTLVAKSVHELQAATSRIDELLSAVGFHRNRAKTRLYKWFSYNNKETFR